MIRVLIVDDYQAVRSGLKAILGPAGDIEVVGEAGDYESALAQCEKTCPDVILMDVDLAQGASGLDLTAEVVKRCPRTKVLILTGSKGGECVDLAMKIGARGYLTQASLTEERLTQAIRTVARGGAFLDDRATAALFDGGWETDLASLTPRERQVLKLIGRGMSNKEIAADLVIDPKTVRNHLNNVYAKLDFSSRVQAAIFARDTLLRT